MIPPTQSRMSAEISTDWYEEIQSSGLVSSISVPTIIHLVSCNFTPYCSILSSRPKLSLSFRHIVFTTH